MSLGGIVGAVAGGVIGFYIGGPQGALYGASIGYGLGMMVDPLTPDTPSPGTPNDMFQVTGNEVGSPIYDLLGTAKIVGGTLLCYGNERVVPQYQKVQGGKGGGGSQKQQTGNLYYMSWVQGLCKGPVDSLLVIYRDTDDVVWTGDLGRPVSGGEETIVIEGVGSATVYFGTDDQTVNANIAALLDDPTLNTPWRGLAYIYFHDCLLGNYNRLPTFGFLVRKRPAIAFNDQHAVGRFDYNPAHALWYILNSMTGLPATWLHTDDFAAAAAALYAEGRGISILFNRSDAALNYIETINSHVGSILRYGSDGKFHPKLIRDDYNPATLPAVTDGNILEYPQFRRRSWLDTINEIKVQYSEIYDAAEEVIAEDKFGYVGLEDRVTLAGWDASWTYPTGEFFVEKIGGNVVNDRTPVGADVAYLNQIVEGNHEVSASLSQSKCAAIFGLIVHYDPITGDRYELVRTDPGDTGMELRGDTTIVLADAGDDGDYVLQVIGATCYAYFNGALLATAPCANRTSGYGGFILGEADIPPIIGYTTQQMAVDESQQLTVTNPVSGVTYTWTLASGGGELSATTGGAVTYTAPASNANCALNPVITCSGCGGTDTLEIAINGAGAGGDAARIWIKECSFTGGRRLCCATVYIYDCAGTLTYGPCAACFVGSIFGDEGCAYACSTSVIAACGSGNQSPDWLEALPHDIRSEAQKAAGCCPAQLL